MQHIPSEEWKTMWQKGKAPKTLDTRLVIVVQENGEVKARLVAKGFRQRPGENYFQTFSPVVDRTSVHTIINIAAIKGLPLFSLDISQAFLQAPIDEDVFIKYSEVESYLTNNPTKIKIATSPSIISGVQSGSNKPDEGFRDILRTIKKNNRRSTINTFD